VKGKLLNYDPEKGLFQIEACVYEGGGGQPADRIKIKGLVFTLKVTRHSKRRVVLFGRLRAYPVKCQKQKWKLT